MHHKIFTSDKIKIPGIIQSDFAARRFRDEEMARGLDDFKRKLNKYMECRSIGGCYLKAKWNICIQRQYFFQRPHCGDKHRGELLPSCPVYSHFITFIAII